MKSRGFKALGLAVKEADMLFDHVGALFVPGRTTRDTSGAQRASGAMLGWNRADRLLLIEQGRLQLQRQRDSLEAVRARGQYFLGVALGADGLAVGWAIARLDGMASTVLWALGLLLMFFATTGFASVVVARKSLCDIDTNLLSFEAPPVGHVLALAYAESVDLGERMVGAAITVLRDSVALLIVGFAWELAAVSMSAGW